MESRPAIRHFDICGMYIHFKSLHFLVLAIPSFNPACEIRNTLFEGATAVALRVARYEILSMFVSVRSAP